ncbi:MAG: hypothetical protein GKS05_08365 [Nitrospirales bacterium]|nr:hypothetical protein [Nitrospirales bacterium]
MVIVRVFGQTLLACVEDPEIECDLSEPVKVRDFLESHQDQFGELVELMKKSELMIAINQKIVTYDAIVKDGDSIKLTHQFNPEHDGALWHNP